MLLSDMIDTRANSIITVSFLDGTESHYEVSVYHTLEDRLEMFIPDKDPVYIPYKLIDLFDVINRNNNKMIVYKIDHERSLMMIVCMSERLFSIVDIVFETKTTESLTLSEVVTVVWPDKLREVLPRSSVTWDPSRASLAIASHQSTLFSNLFVKSVSVVNNGDIVINLGSWG